MYCTECGNKREPNANFCQNCGLKLKGDNINSSDFTQTQQPQISPLLMGGFMLGASDGFDLFGGGDCGGGNL